MLELIAEGAEPAHRWKQNLAGQMTWKLGREAGMDLSTPWDPLISRHHATLTVGPTGIHVVREPKTRNPLFFQGNEVDECRVRVGERFVLGTTMFRVVGIKQDDDFASGQPVEEHLFSRQELNQFQFLNADKRIEVLSRLPDLIANVPSENELFDRLVHFLLDGLIHAEAVAIVKPVGEGHVEILNWDRRRETSGDFRTSRRLVHDAIERDCSVLHIWNSESGELGDPMKSDELSPYTASAQFDWAVCTPLPPHDNETIAIYFAGGFVDLFEMNASEKERASQIKSDIRFAELVGEIVSTIQNLNRLERQQAGLRKFFSAPILDALGSRFDTKLLEPRECDVTVMFCDLRGFSKRAELEADDLLGLLERVSMALEVMTKAILKHGGVIGDFHGDAALGFWGWPLSSNEAALSACRAALAIRETFRKNHSDVGHPLADFEMGIGLAHGRAVAGTIGTSDQVKVTVFGPVVNLASRLEGMTKTLRVPILLDHSVAEIIDGQLDSEAGRLRHMGRILPYGMDRPTNVYELLESFANQTDLSDALVREFELGVNEFLAGNWDSAYEHLHKMPPGDRAQDYFMMLITQHNREAPADWNGVIRLNKK